MKYKNKKLVLLESYQKYLLESFLVFLEEEFCYKMLDAFIINYL